MIIQDFTKKLQKWRGSLLLLLAAGIIIFALCTWGCAGTRSLAGKQTAIRSDNLQLSEMRGVSYERIPMSRTEIKIPNVTLEKMPFGTGFYKESGQAKLKVVRERDTIFIEATCDSLQRRINYLESMLYNTHNVIQTDIPPPALSGWRWFWIRAGQISVIAFVAWNFPRLIKILKKIIFKI